MLDLNIHNVVSVELNAPREFDANGSEAFVTRKLVIMDANGQRTEITLFGADKGALQATVDTSAVSLKV